MQYQHKILRKYAMLGMIQYSAVPFFHHLVINRDYKMICIFEVFALNRNEDDFLENLGILNEIRLQNEDSQINTIDDSDIEGDDRQHLIQNVPAPSNILSVQPQKDADAAKVLEFETVEKPQNYEFQ